MRFVTGYAYNQFRVGSSRLLFLILAKGNGMLILWLMSEFSRPSAYVVPRFWHNFSTKHAPKKVTNVTSFIWHSSLFQTLTDEKKYDSKTSNKSKKRWLYDRSVIYTQEFIYTHTTEQMFTRLRIAGLLSNKHRTNVLQHDRTNVLIM